MKKYYIIGGLLVAGVGSYLFVKKQVDMALKYDYKIKNFRYISTKGNDVTVSATIAITNNSRFKLTITSFDLTLFYNGKKFADVVSTKEVYIEPKSTFEVTGIGVLNVNDLKEGLPQFIFNVVAQKPIDIEVEGTLQATMLGISSTVEFNKEKFRYSNNLLADYGLKDKADRFKEKYANVLSIFGIK